MTGHLFRGQVAELALVFAARLAAGAGGVVLSIVVARLTDAVGLGSFTVALSVLALLAILARFGRDVCLTRGVARLIAVADPAPIAGHLATALHQSLKASLVCLAALFSWTVLSGTSTLAREPLLLLAPAVVPLTLLMILAGYLKGIRKAYLAALVELGGLSCLAALVLLLALALGAAPGLSEAALGVAGTITAAAIVVFFLVLRDARRRSGETAVRKRADAAAGAEFWSGAPHFMLIALAGYLTQAGAFVILGPALAEGDLGLLRAAERLALLVAFPLTAIDPFVAPRIVERAARAETAGLRQLMLRACLGSAALGLPVGLVLVAVPGWALGVFGGGFEPAADLLRILVLGQLIVAVGGPFSMLLSMTGRERAHFQIMLATLAFGFVALPAAALLAGVAGAAWALVAVQVLRVGLVVACAARGAPNPVN